MPIKMPQKELDVLSLLLRSEQPMTISDIVAMNPDYTINMIKPIIRKLSKLEMVEVAGIVYREPLSPEPSNQPKQLILFFKIFSNRSTSLSVSFLRITHS